MPLNTMQTLIIACCLVAGTVITRFLPFLLFPENKTPPKYILYLGKVLPPAVIGLLVIYCLQDVHPLIWPHGLPELISITLVAGLQQWKHNTLLSIGTGTMVYMLLVQCVFL